MKNFECVLDWLWLINALSQNCLVVVNITNLECIFYLFIYLIFLLLYILLNVNISLVLSRYLDGFSVFEVGTCYMK